MIRPVILLLLAALLSITAGGCGHNPLEKRIEQPLYYLDNDLPFQPKRIWRLWVRWEPYLLDEKRAVVIKEFQLVIQDSAERTRFEREVRRRGGEKPFLTWLESNLFPIGNWERREDGKITRYKDMTVVVLTYKAFKEVPTDGYLRAEPVHFPDPLLMAATLSCKPLDWSILRKGDSVGTEVILESRDETPDAERWRRRDFDAPTFAWRAWSVGQGKRMSYRTAVFVKTNLSRCPMPPEIREEYRHISNPQAMGVSW